MSSIEALRKSVLSGIMIGIGCTVYLSVNNKIMGSMLFSIGLFMICSFGMYLFTGKIGYVIKTKNNPNCLLIWAGNLIGSLIVSVMVRFAKPGLHITAAQIVSDKLKQDFLSVAMLSVLCGFLMYLAVENFSRHPDSLSGITGIFLCVSTFILCGFEHSIADMNYCVLSVSSLDDFLSSLYFILVVSVFNGIGALLLNLLTTPIIKKQKRQ